MPLFFLFCLIYLVAERKAPVDTDGIPSSPIATVDHVAVFVTELLLHNVEITLGNIKYLEHFIFVEMRIGGAGLVGVADQGLKYHESFVLGLLHILFSRRSLFWRSETHVRAVEKSLCRILLDGFISVFSFGLAEGKSKTSLEMS